MMRGEPVRTFICLVFGFVLLAGCDGASGTADASLDGGVDASAPPCSRDLDCDDSRFCAVFRCMPGVSGADARGCVDIGSPCSAGRSCDEAMDACVDDECVPGEEDRDGDGVDSVACGGSDCADDDPTRFDGNAELCDGDDEDCNLATHGGTDVDGDGFESSACCNGSQCGNDCNDARRDVYPGATESCNAVDDNCDGSIDELGAFCPVGMCMDRRCSARGWERVYGDEDWDFANGMTVDDEGNVYGYLRVTTDFDGDGSSDPGNLVSYTADGRYRWHSTADFPSGPAAPTFARGRADDLLAFAGPDSRLWGAAQWHRADDGSLANEVDFAPEDPWETLEVHGAVWSDSVLYTLSSVLAGFGPERRNGILLARFAASGEELDTRVIEGAVPDSIGASRAGVVIAGYSSTPLELGAGVTVTGHFVVQLSNSFETTWGISNIAGGADNIALVAISDAGDVALSGEFSGAYENFWDGSTLTATDSATLLVSVASDGAYRWHRLFDDPGTVDIDAIDFDERGGLMVSGSFSGDIDVSPRGLPTATGACDAFFGIFDVTDRLFVIEARSFAGAGCETVASANIDAFGNLVVLGTFDDDITLPSGRTYNAAGTLGNNDVFLVRIADIGAP